MELLMKVILLFTLLRSASSQSCSEANRTDNLGACLSEIGTFAQDNTRYWFGSGYNNRCPDGPVATVPDCSLLARIEIPQSIASLMYPDGSFNSSKLDRYLDVKYTSNPGTYSGCDNEYSSQTTVRFTLDPVSMETHNCWDARGLPEVTWTCEPDQLYSLLLLDVGNKFIHAIYVNIAANDIANADAVEAYVGPGNPFRFTNVYVFLLFKQSERVDPVSVSEYTPGQFNLTKFNLLQSSTDLIAMNWILAPGDLFSIGSARDDGFLDNCPSFLTDDIKTQDRSFIPENPQFEVGVYLKYRSMAMGYVSCCKTLSLQAKNTTVNPLGNSWVKTGDVRNVPEVDLIRTIVRFNPATGFEGKLYTLLMLDPANDLLTFSSKDEPFIYWMVTNIAGGDVTSGDTILPYIGIMPFDTSPHQYYFLLYEQSGDFSADSLVQYTSMNCTGVTHLRCRFKITEYVTDNNFKLVGATWMRSQNDDFVAYARVQLSEPEAVACMGVPGYISGCGASSQSCPEANRTDNLGACLSEIGTFAQDNTRYWFGSGYNNRCPDGPVATVPDCSLLARIEIPQSIGSLMYPDGGFNSSKLDRYLDVKYTSNPGTYSGCDNGYSSQTTVRFILDPVSMESHNCWDARDLPEVTWTYEPDQLYSLLLLDVGNKFIHAIYVNIAANDIANADAVKAYVGPGNPFRFTNVYVFLLFKQSERVDPVSVSEYTPGQFNLTKFNLLQSSTDLIAMNWILAPGDLFSIGSARDDGFLDNCPSFVADDIKTQDRSFIPENPQFEVGVYLKYRPTAMGYVSCCKTFSLQSKNTTVNPLGNSWVKTGDVRNVPEVNLIRTIVRFNPATGFEGKLYTLLMLDPANDLLTFSSKDEPFIYWMVTNIAGGDVTSGDTILPYIGIMPFDTSPHQYYFLLYEQSGDFSADSLVQYTSMNCTGVTHLRCRFKITEYVADNNFKLVGATWMRSQNDDFVAYGRVQLGDPETVACMGVPGYISGCGACSLANRQRNLAGCLADVASLAVDTFRYWFGSSYNQRCPYGNLPTELECTKPASLEIPQSIISLTFPPGAFNPRSLDRFLEVNYTSPPGSFSSCGNEYQIETTTHFTSNPLSMETHDCRDARDMPAFSWTTEPNQLYSLVMFDVGFQFIHALYANIQGNDVDNSDVVSAYQGPGTILRVGGLYVFYLFTQDGRTQPDPRFSNRSYVFNMTEFMQLQKLTGPVAMNWLIGSHDLYTAQRLKRSGRADTCPTFFADAIVDPPRPFIPEEPKFDVGVYVTYRTPQFRFESCCKQYLLPATNISLNPLGHGRVKPGEARTVPEIQLTRTIAFFKPATGFTGKVYTLIMVDPDIVTPAYGTNEKPFVHWLVTNIRNGDVTSGDEIVSYLLPAPFNDAEHYFYFLVYEQPGTLNSTPPAEFTNDVCTGIDAFRCLFDITNYTSVNSLKLVGASWMISQKDEYVPYHIENTGFSTSEICKGVTGYVAGCQDDDPASSVETLQLSLLTPVSAYILGLLMR